MSTVLNLQKWEEGQEEIPVKYHQLNTCIFCKLSIKMTIKEEGEKGQTHKNKKKPGRR